ncbi:hypothetical protein [Legionella sp. km772]|uniref:hypothetical protein n=1 Tax=Legionella sp. km772 TaxID=2498111 RepID=UPI000F8F1879|nr:hypothetical protein [Legionella sp. km772]RUR10691.1 hypothetical protein ELY15_07830 [Legionella sp. km772]
MKKQLVFVFFWMIVNSVTAQAWDGFLGNWNTTFGVMKLEKVEGNQLKGVYMLSQQSCQIEGYLENQGKKFIFTYREPQASGEGYFELAENGLSFSGFWRQKGHSDWQPWKGERFSSNQKSFNGVWKTDYGTMRLIQNKQEIEGVYDPELHATIHGVLSNNRFNFTYQEPNAEGEGWFELTETGNRLKGAWREKGSQQWRKWEGSRILPMPGLKWLVVVEARWETSLEQKEFSFGEMLKSFFARIANVQVRHRYFTDKNSFTKWVQQIAYLPEPVVLSIASHGSVQGITVGQETITGNQISQALRYAANLELLHFSACLMMKEQVPKEIHNNMSNAVHFPISGYSTSVDWSLSAIIEFLYFDMILSRDMSPQLAAKNLLEILPLAGDKALLNQPFPAAGFVLLEP